MQPIELKTKFDPDDPLRDRKWFVLRSPHIVTTPGSPNQGNGVRVEFLTLLRAGCFYNGFRACNFFLEVQWS